jgi:hypothetical protein
MSEHVCLRPELLPGRPVRPMWRGGCDSLPPGADVAQEGDRFIRNQIVVTGPRTQVRSVLGDMPDIFPDPPIAEIDLGELGGLLRAGQSSEESGKEPGMGARYLGDAQNELVIGIYRLPEGRTVEEVIERLRNEPSVRDAGIYVEPNYLTGGSRGCIEGGPAGIGVPGGGQTAFWQQWALDDHGIDLEVLGAQAPGQEIRVAVFDTSPFIAPGGWRIPWIHPFLDLCVSHPEPLAYVMPEVPGDDYSDHGLFVSSLVHAIAPLSDIHLIRVLNEHNLGDLGTLVLALDRFMRAEIRRAGTLARAVFNLSLGLNADPGVEGSWLLGIRDYIKALDGSRGFERANFREGDLPVVYLEETLDLAQEGGATVVAAAGNESNATPPPMGPNILGPEIPASYPSVIGVAGHNVDQKRSSFSNAGDIAAPGGNGPPNEPPLDDDGNIRNPCDWLIGLSMRSAPVDGYMYWMGTSFATPLVAGRAARILGSGGLPGNVPTTLAQHVENAGGALGVGCTKVS